MLGNVSSVWTQPTTNMVSLYAQGCVRLTEYKQISRTFSSLSNYSIEISATWIINKTLLKMFIKHERVEQFMTLYISLQLLFSVQ
jgi:hypothetical protein